MIHIIYVIQSCRFGPIATSTSTTTRVEHYIPQFLSKTKQDQYDILVTGINTDQPEFNSTNTTITIAVQKFVLTTKRFSDIE